MTASRFRNPPAALVLRFTLFAIAALAGADASPACAGWNTGLGGRADRAGLSSENGPTGADLLWQGGRTSLIAFQGVCDGDLLVTQRMNTTDVNTGCWVVGQDLSTGHERWAIQLPYDFPGTSWRSRVTAIRDDRVYATRSGNTNADYLYALSPADGSILWRSEDLIDESSTESPSFASDGDLIVGNFNWLLRIRHTDGHTLWKVPRSTPTSDGATAAVFGNRAYVWEPTGNGPKVTAFDVGTGQRLYSTPAIAGGLIQQVGLLCGPDGTVYAPRTQNNPSTDYFVALTDTGSGFVEKWRVPMGYTPFASFGIGPDGTVYTYSRTNEIIRLDPATGHELNRSIQVTTEFPFMPRMAIDAAGRVYLTNGAYSGGRLYAFDAGLALLWSEGVPQVNLGGPILGDGGILVVCGTGTDVRAYRTVDPAGIVAHGSGSGPNGDSPSLVCSPNPCVTGTTVSFTTARAGTVSLAVHDAAGRLVRSLVRGANVGPGAHQLSWDGRDEQGRSVAAGLYLARMESREGTGTVKLIVTR
jgi:outer membrane protein assembly factor BamB